MVGNTLSIIHYPLNYTLREDNHYFLPKHKKETCLQRVFPFNTTFLTRVYLNTKLWHMHGNILFIFYWQFKTFAKIKYWVWKIYTIFFSQAREWSCLSYLYKLIVVSLLILHVSPYNITSLWFSLFSKTMQQVWYATLTERVWYFLKSKRMMFPMFPMVSKTKFNL